MGDMENKENKNTGEEQKMEEWISIKERRRQSRGNPVAAAFKENKSMLMLFAVIVAALGVILAGIMVWKVPVAVVCIIVLLEAGLTVCLHDVPVWLHGLVVIAQIIAGILCENMVFVVLCAAIYLLGIFTFRFIRD